MLRQLRPGSTGHRSHRSLRPQGALLPTALGCSAILQCVALSRLLGGCSSTYCSCGLLLLFAFPSLSCHFLLLSQSFSISLPGAEFSPWLHSFLHSYLYPPAIDLNFIRNRITDHRIISARRDFQRSSGSTSFSKQGYLWSSCSRTSPVSNTRNWTTCPKRLCNI